MFWSNRRTRRSRSEKPKTRQQTTRQLLFESLETRRVLAAGIVDVHIFPVLAAGRLDLVGDGSDENEMQISQTANAGEFRVDGLNGTLLQLDGAGVTMSTVTVNGITANIHVLLGTGDDVFTLDDTFAAAGQPSSVPANLEIVNNDGSNRNFVSGTALINGNLLVAKVAGSTGYSELHILDTTVIGSTSVDNTGGGTGGDSWTEIDNGQLQGNGGPGPAFTLVNALGKDILEVMGNSQFGTGPFAILGPVVVISNGEGGSRTSFTALGHRWLWNDDCLWRPVHFQQRICLAPWTL